MLILPDRLHPHPGLRYITQSALPYRQSTLLISLCFTLALPPKSSELYEQISGRLSMRVCVAPVDRWCRQQC